MNITSWTHSVASIIIPNTMLSKGDCRFNDTDAGNFSSRFYRIRMP